MNQPQNVAALLGRILLALIFITSGFGKISGFDGTAGYIASKGLPAASVVAALTILIELGGGLAEAADVLERRGVVVAHAQGRHVLGPELGLRHFHRPSVVELGPAEVALVAGDVAAGDGSVPP